jgi:hypothetical protein
MALSAWVFHEHLTIPQLWSAAVLIVGAFLAMHKAHRHCGGGEQ